MAAHEQPHEHAERDDEVCGAVEDVEELNERGAEEPVLDGGLVEQPDCLLDVDHMDRVVERVQRCIAGTELRRAELVAHKSVHQIHGADDEDLAYPWQTAAYPRRRDLDLRRHEYRV